MESDPSQSHCSCRRNASAFGNGGRFLSVSIFEHLPHRVLRKWFLSAAKGAQSNYKWHWIGGWSGMGRGLSSTVINQSLRHFSFKNITTLRSRLYALPWTVRGGQCLCGNRAQAARVISASCVCVCKGAVCVLVYILWVVCVPHRSIRMWGLLLATV